MPCPCCDPCRGSCASSSDCATGCRCYEGQCVKECGGPCDSNTDCDAGCVCVNGQCVPSATCCCINGVMVAGYADRETCEADGGTWYTGAQCDLPVDFQPAVTVNWCGLSVSGGDFNNLFGGYLFGVKDDGNGLVLNPGWKTYFRCNEPCVEVTVNVGLDFSGRGWICRICSTENAATCTLAYDDASPVGRPIPCGAPEVLVNFAP